MTIIPDHRQVPAAELPPAGYEDATVYSSGVVLHPLPGRPKFEGVLNGPAGPMARFRDGDLVIRAGLQAIDSWAEELRLARRDLQGLEDDTNERTQS